MLDRSKGHVPPPFLCVCARTVLCAQLQEVFNAGNLEPLTNKDPIPYNSSSGPCWARWDEQSAWLPTWFGSSYQCSGRLDRSFCHGYKLLFCPCQGVYVYMQLYVYIYICVYLLSFDLLVLSIAFGLSIM